MGKKWHEISSSWVNKCKEHAREWTQASSLDVLQSDLFEHYGCTYIVCENYKSNEIILMRYFTTDYANCDNFSQDLSLNKSTTNVLDIIISVHRKVSSDRNS